MAAAMAVGSGVEVGCVMRASVRNGRILGRGRAGRAIRTIRAIGRPGGMSAVRH
jgi:hypothetical protein